MELKESTEAIAKLLNLGPEALALFLIADVRQYNLTGKHIGQKASNYTTGGAGTDNPKAPQMCDPDVLQKDYLNYVSQQGLARENALPFDQWKAQYRPQCP